MWTLIIFHWLRFQILISLFLLADCICRRNLDWFSVVFQIAFAQTDLLKLETHFLNVIAVLSHLPMDAILNLFVTVLFALIFVDLILVLVKFVLCTFALYQNCLYWRHFWLLLENLFSWIFYHLFAFWHSALLFMHQWWSGNVNCLWITVGFIFLFDLIFLFLNFGSAWVLLLQSLLPLCNDNINGVKLLQFIQTKIVIFLFFSKCHLFSADFCQVYVKINILKVVQVNVSVQDKQLCYCLVSSIVFFNWYELGISWEH